MNGKKLDKNVNEQWRKHLERRQEYFDRFINDREYRRLQNSKLAKVGLNRKTFGKLFKKSESLASRVVNGYRYNREMVDYLDTIEV